MTIILGARSLSRLEGVHPDLVRVVKRAALLATPEQDFTVLQGLRTREECCVNYGKGRTAAECIAKGVPASYAQPHELKVTWLADPFKSKHVDGKAVDLAPWPIDWHDMGRFKALATLMRSAAHQEGVAIVCGIDWVKSPDPGHFELVQ